MSCGVHAWHHVVVCSRSFQKPLMAWHVLVTGWGYWKRIQNSCRNFRSPRLSRRYTTCFHILCSPKSVNTIDAINIINTERILHLPEIPSIPAHVLHPSTFQQCLGKSPFELAVCASCPRVKAYVLDTNRIVMAVRALLNPEDVRGSPRAGAFFLTKGASSCEIYAVRGGHTRKEDVEASKGHARNRRGAAVKGGRGAGVWFGTVSRSKPCLRQCARLSAFAGEPLFSMYHALNNTSTSEVVDHTLFSTFKVDFSSPTRSNTCSLTPGMLQYSCGSKAIFVF